MFANAPLLIHNMNQNHIYYKSTFWHLLRSNGDCYNDGDNKRPSDMWKTPQNILINNLW